VDNLAVVWPSLHIGTVLNSLLRRRIAESLRHWLSTTLEIVLGDAAGSHFSTLCTFCPLGDQVIFVMRHARQVSLARVNARAFPMLFLLASLVVQGAVHT
jgi:hypothetical protein